MDASLSLTPALVTVLALGYSSTVYRAAPCPLPSQGPPNSKLSAREAEASFFSSPYSYGLQGRKHAEGDVSGGGVSTDGDSEETKVSSVVDPALATTTPAADTQMPGSTTAASVLGGPTTDLTADFTNAAMEPPPAAPREDTKVFPGGAEEGPDAAQLPVGASLVQDQDYADSPSSGAFMLGPEPSETDRMAAVTQEQDDSTEEVIASQLQATISPSEDYEESPRVEHLTALVNLNETEDRPVTTEPVNIPEASGTGDGPSGPGEDGSQTRQQSSGHEEPLVSEMTDSTSPTAPEVQPDEPATAASMSHEIDPSVDLSGKWVLCAGVGNATQPSQDIPTATSREEVDAVAEDDAREASSAQDHVVEGKEAADIVEVSPTARPRQGQRGKVPFLAEGPEYSVLAYGKSKSFGLFNVFESLCV